MEEKLPSVKITLLGNCGVGKSSIIQRYANNTFSEDYISTNGASYCSKEIERRNKKYLLDMWDTAGQEKYRSLGKNFYREAYIVILVYDITRQDSIDGLKNIWYPDLQKYGENFKVLAVVGNKCDRFEEDGVVDEEEAKSFAKEINGIFMNVSAKHGDNIENLFNTLIDSYIEPDFQNNISEHLTIRKNSYKIKQNTKEEEKEFKEKKKKKCC